MADCNQTSLVDSVTQTSEEFTPPGEHIFHDDMRASNLLTGFSKLYKNQEFVDMVLCVGSAEFPCHRNVLAVSSPYFMAMFSSKLAESQQEKITLQDMESLTLSLVLDYIYTGRVLLTEETVQNLLSAANLFQLLALREGCAEFMMSHVTVNNCIGVYFFARAHECDVLALKAKEIINSKFSMLCRQQEFLSLPADKLVEIISDDDLNVTGEETVYEACMEWLNFDPSSRFTHVAEVMKCVRFAIISSYYFCDKIDHNQTLRQDEEVSQTLDRIRYHHMLKNRQSEVDLNLMPRRGMAYERGVMIVSNPYAEEASKKYNSMEMLMPRTGEVVLICKLPQSLYTPAVAITGDNQIYMAGGALRKINYRGSVTTEGISSCLYLFDHTAAQWTAKAKMHTTRSQFSLVIVDGYVYAIGGHDGTDILNSVEKYDPHTNTWTVVSPLPRPLRFTAALSYRGKLLVMGGEDVGVVCKNCYRYDPMEDTWTELPHLSVPRMLAGSIVFKDKIWVIGGNAAVSERWHKEYLPEFCVGTVEVFDPETETWSFGPELPNPLCGAGVVKYGESVLIVGGEDDKSWMAGMCWLREDKDKMYWSEGIELPTVMSTFGCVVANMPKDLLSLS
ncbi:kelch repeat and BTB domain-containing protein 8-like [Babylonia areolata]|uniref:kelch repeat and BTB domain-containing protein 8-like n=1 Tax=Babylonia areolata TaxID=304850 RepID=UPI003FD56543